MKRKWFFLILIWCIALAAFGLNSLTQKTSLDTDQPADSIQAKQEESNSNSTTESDAEAENGTDAEIETEAAPEADAGDAVLEGPFAVERVVDGDTIIVDYDGNSERVRLIGIDTPESVHPDESRNTAFGEITSDFTKEALEGQSVYLEFDVELRDQYDRLLAYVYLDGEMFNKTLLQEGMAMLSTYPPNVKYVDDFTAIQEEARNAGIGVWEGYEPPKTSGNFVASKNSDKFHRTDCRYAASIAEQNRVWFDTVDEAEAAGYQPCSTCTPNAGD